MLYGKRIDPEHCILKCYTDLLVFSFIRQNIPAGSRMLDVGGGDSRILNFFKKEYECWNVDKLEGLGEGPKQVHVEGYRLVQDYMGNFNQEIPDGHFDFVFSISALEHTPNDPQLFYNILRDIERVLKPGGYSLHCFDIVFKKDRIWTNKLLPFLIERVNPLNPYVPWETVRHDPDLYTLSEEIYNKFWEPVTKKPYAEFGKVTSYNILWQKQRR
jgi:ubiquinone/menaquinone biosynthesis C-methylase UbiE